MSTDTKTLPPTTDEEQREKDVEALAALAEEYAKPIAGLAAFMTGEIGSFWLVTRALELAARARAANLLRPERAADFERAAALAAERIGAAWNESEARLDFRDAIERATQGGGAA